MPLFYEKRRSDRVDLPLRVEVIGMDSTGHEVFAKGNASVLSKNGATIRLDCKFVPNQMITVRNLANSKESEARIIGLIRQEHDLYAYGVILTDPSANMWDLQFPDLPVDQNPLLRIVLTCKACNQREVVYPDEAEVLVVEASGSLQRHCNTCRVATPWSQASPADSQSILLRAEEISLKSEVVEPAANKRKSKRLPSKFSACIRLIGGRGELVACEDISRGGLCFRSLRLYPKGTEIEVAVPYTKGSGNIFVRAQIAHVTPVAKLFRHGAKYL